MAVEYIKGETNFIADCLSRAPVAKDTIKLPILQVNQITAHTRCTQDRIDRLQQSTAKDDTLVLLKHTVQHGWPQTITELPPELPTGLSGRRFQLKMGFFSKERE